jgi:hypothetical protein
MSAPLIIFITLLHVVTSQPTAIIMIPPSPDVHKALEKVVRVHLTHPASALLRNYILEAVQPPAAADYVQRRLSAEGHANALVADWIHVIDSGSPLLSAFVHTSHLLTSPDSHFWRATASSIT